MTQYSVLFCAFLFFDVGEMKTNEHGPTITKKHVVPIEVGESLADLVSRIDPFYEVTVCVSEKVIYGQPKAVLTVTGRRTVHAKLSKFCELFQSPEEKENESLLRIKAVLPEIAEDMKALSGNKRF